MDLERMRQYVKSKSTVQPSGCWEWRLSLDKDGYGRAHMRVKGFSARAHRFSYAAFKGDIPDDYVVMHSCDNPRCVNPEHLTIGTQLENIDDAFTKGRGGAFWKPGAVNPKSILTDDAVRAIRSAAKLGRPHRLIAADHGCSKTLVTLVATNQRWAHVT